MNKKVKHIVVEKIGIDWNALVFKGLFFALGICLYITNIYDKPELGGLFVFLSTIMLICMPFTFSDFKILIIKKTIEHEKEGMK